MSSIGRLIKGRFGAIERLEERLRRLEDARDGLAHRVERIERWHAIEAETYKWFRYLENAMCKDLYRATQAAYAESIEAEMEARERQAHALTDEVYFSVPLEGTEGAEPALRI